MVSTYNPTCKSIDDSFGPYAGQCRGGFDFTLLFEDAIFSIGPIAILLLITPFRIFHLWRKPTNVSRSLLLYVKLVCPNSFLTSCRYPDWLILLQGNMDAPRCIRPGVTGVVVQAKHIHIRRIPSLRNLKLYG